MAHSVRSFIPAAGYDWLLPLYDPFQRWILREDAVKRPLVDQAAIQPGHRVLDIGCGTGSLTVLVKRLHPDAQVIDLDPDPKALATAVRKAARWRVTVDFERGFSDQLPVADQSFNVVLSSLMFHHLSREEKFATLREVRRVLRPGGSFHILDFGPPRTRVTSLLAHVFHRMGHSRDNIEGRIPSFMTETGFHRSEEVASRSMLVGSMSYYRGFRPAAAAS